MRGSNPRQPTGSDAEAIYHQSTHERVHGAPSQFVDSSTVKWNRTTKGVSAHVRLPRGGSAAPEPATLERFTFISARGDYSVCQPFGTTNPNLRVNIARQPELRISISQEVIDDVTVTYSSADYTTAATQFFRRDATLFGITEKQVIVPRYIAGTSIIYAMKVSGGTGVLSDAVTGVFPIGSSVEYLEISPRAWAAKADQNT